MTHVPAQRTSTPTLRRDADTFPSAPAPAPSGSASAAPGGLTATVTARADQALEATHRFVPTALTVSLALLFLWFGALKVAGSSPVTLLVSSTLPWFDPDLLMPALGALEVLLALGVLISRTRRLVLVMLAAHLSGTFLSFVMAPELMFQDGNPLLLTADGEFVLKNLVLISAALLLTAHSRTSTTPMLRPATV